MEFCCPILYITCKYIRSFQTMAFLRSGTLINRNRFYCFTLYFIFILAFSPSLSAFLFIHPSISIYQAHMRLNYQAAINLLKTPLFRWKNVWRKKKTKTKESHNNTWNIWNIILYYHYYMYAYVCKHKYYLMFIM